MSRVGSVRALVGALLLGSALVGVTGCAGTADCEPPDHTATAPANAATANISQGTVMPLDNLRVAYGNGGCASGEWRARLTISKGDGTSVDASLAVGDTQQLDDGRTITLIAVGAGGASVDVALSDADE